MIIQQETNIKVNIFYRVIFNNLTRNGKNQRNSICREQVSAKKKLGQAVVTYKMQASGTVEVVLRIQKRQLDIEKTSF